MTTDRPTDRNEPCPRHILLVDDDARQLKLSRLRLEDAGFAVETASDASEALALLAHRRPDAVMSDVLMGDIDGFGFCRKVRAERALDGVPVILLSAHYDGAGDRDLARRVGASDLVQRTPDFDAELAALARTLGTTRVPDLPEDDRATYERHLRTNAQQLSKLLGQAQRAEARYRKLLEHAHDAIVITRLDGTILEANTRWTEILGLPVGALVGRRLSDFGIEPTGRPEGYGPFPFTRSDGRTVHLKLSRTVVEVEGESLVLSIANDVTELVASSRATATAEERYRALAERIPDVLWTRGATDGVTYFTPNAEALFGETRAALSVASLSSRFARVHPDDAGAVTAAFAAYFERGVTFDLEYRYRRKDGRWLWLRERSFPLIEREGATFGEGMISDVTERKRLEEDLRQAQKLEALGQLTGGIAHDFNNILATILANAQFLIEALPAGVQARDDAEAIRAAGESAAALTRQLLAFGRRQVLEPRVVDLDAAVSGVQRVLRSIIRENITFKHLPCSSLGRVRIDVGQLEQVVMNLVINACDAMPAGGDLTIETANAEEKGDVLLRVRDSGHGMDEATMQRIFEPFFTTKGKGRGTGLGLATCYGIVQQSGGRITVESEVGRGTTFTIALPRTQAEPDSAPVLREAAEVRGAESILLIEDDPAVRTVVKRLLERRGYAVIAAEDASRALEIGQGDSAIDLVVSDIVLPGATGPDVVSRLQETRPDLRAIFVSGYNELPANDSTAGLTSLQIIEKPFKPERLLGAIRAELAR